MEDIIFESIPTADKNSREYDIALLEEIKKLSNIPVKKFDTIIRQIMRKKSSYKLWFTNNPSREWDGKTYRDCNYRCCPSSHKARYYFCLVLERNKTGINVIDGFLSAI